MEGDEILTLFVAGHYAQIPPLLGNLDNMQYERLLKIAIENDYIDLIIIFLQNGVNFMNFIQELLELSIKDTKSFFIFNMLFNRCILCRDIINIDPIKLLFYSVESNNISVFFVLIKEFFFDKSHNIDEITNVDGETLLMVAAKNQYYELVDFMVRFCNADLYKAINKGYCTVDSINLFYKPEDQNYFLACTKPSPFM